MHITQYLKTVLTQADVLYCPQCWCWIRKETSAVCSRPALKKFSDSWHLNLWPSNLCPCQGAAAPPPVLQRAWSYRRAERPPRAHRHPGAGLPPGPGHRPPAGAQERGTRQKPSSPASTAAAHIGRTLMRFSFYFFLSDLWADSDLVLEGTLWVPVHADWSKLVQLFLWSWNSQGQSTSQLLVMSGILYFLTSLASPGGSAGLWCDTRFWQELHRQLHWGKKTSTTLFYLFLYFYVDKYLLFILTPMLHCSLNLYW